LKLYIGGFDKNATEKDLRTLFAKYGKVGNVKVWIDREFGKRRGFAWVEIEGSDWNAERAIIDLDGKRWHGLLLEVRPARKQGW
jgi:RNA recognition motif-containing protein